MADGSLIFETLLDPTGFKKGAVALGRISAKAAGLATAALSAFSVYAAKAGADFGAAMSEVQAISGATADDMARLTELAKKMGATTKFSASESAEALKYMAMAGWDTEKMLAGLPGVMNLAAASGENLGTVSDILTDAMTAFGLAADKSGHFADVLAQTSSKANTNVALLGESFKYVAPLAGALGYSAEDTAVALGLMANAGIKGSQAGTALRAALTRLVKPTKQVQEGFDLVGISAQELQGLSLRETMDKLRSSFGALTQEQQAQAAAMIFGQEAMSGMLAIINASDADFKNLIQNIDNATGSAERMAKVMQDNLAGDITIMKSALEGLGLAFYEGIDNPLREVVQNATGYLGDLTNSFKSAEQLKKELMASGLDADQAQFELDQSGLANAVGGFEGFFNKIGDVLARMIGDVASYAPKLLQAGVDLLQSLINGIMQNKDQIISGIMETLSVLVVGVGEFLPTLIDAGVGLISALADSLTQDPGAMAQKGIELLIGIADSIIANIPVLAAAGLQLLLGLAQGIAANLPLLIAEVPRIINEFSSAIYGLIPQILSTGLQIIVALGQGLIEAIPTLIANIPQIIMAIVNAITLFNWASVGENVITKFGSGMKSLAGSLKNTAVNLANSVTGGLKTLITSAPQVARNGMTSLINGLKSFAGALKNNATQTMQSAVQGFLKIIPQLPRIGIDMIKGIVKGIANSAGLLVDKMTELAKSAWETVKNFFGIKSPSRLMKDTVGKPIVQGIAVGIKAEQQKLNDSIISMSEEALEIAMNKAGNYEEIGKIYSDKMAKGIKKSADLSIDAVKALVNNSVLALAGNNKKAKSEYVRAGKEISTAYAKAIKGGIAKVQEEISAEVQRITQEAQQQYDDIIAKKDDMERKLAGLGELFTIDQESGNAVIENINNQIDAIKRYDEVLTSLKSKGAGDDFLNEVTKLGVSEGTKFGEALLKLSDDQFKSYQANWAEKQKLAKEVAMKFYKDQLDALQSDFVNKLDSTLKSVPNTVKNVGVNAIEGMIRGMDSRKQGAINKAREIADAVISEMQRAMDIHSPSRVMRDLIGKNIVRGIEVGITDEQRNMVARMRSAVENAKEEMSAVVSAKTNVGSRTQTITNNNDNGVQQTVNFYQPVKSAIENAREMKRAAKELAYGC
ncbi:MAG: phage tail tape measure protein [Peptostreptococcaceae bacterium]|nr:phage tail tape measure protein [Peptostreptococcaceae bacterium]